LRPTPQIAVDLIKAFEGFHAVAAPGEAKPYVCPAGYWTQGYGSLRGPKGTKISAKSRHITEMEGMAMLRRDLGSAETSIHRLLPLWSWQITDAQFGALVSFIYNLGSGNFSSSTLRRKIRDGDLKGAADEFPRWVYGGGRKLPGLVRRRDAERTLFLGS
jgi:lysozyme